MQLQAFTCFCVHSGTVLRLVLVLLQTQIEIQKQLEQQLHDSGHGIGMIEVRLLLIG